MQKMILFMDPARQSVLIRLRPELMARAKRQARMEHLSFNAFVEKTLEKAVELEWPVIPPDYKVSEEIRSLTCIPGNWRPTQEQLDADPRLAHIWEEMGDEG